MGLVEDQFKEINNHVRHVMQLLVTWYTFFVASNVVAIGWIATTDKTRLLTGNLMLGCGITGVFVTVNLLGIIALVYIRRYFIETNAKISIMVQLIEPETNYHSYFRESPAPITLFNISSTLMVLSLLALLSFWALLLKFWL